jgi:hypothetical protein
VAPGCQWAAAAVALDHSELGETQLVVTALSIARLTLALFLVPSAIGKLLDLRGFIQGVRDYAILPDHAVRPVALALPVGEAALGLALTAGMALPITGTLTALLLASFILAVGVNLHRDRDIACSCHGIGSTKRIGAATIARAFALLSLSIVVAALGAISASGWTWNSIGSTTDVVLVAFMTSCTVALVYLAEWTLDTHSLMRSVTERLKKV